MKKKSKKILLGLLFGAATAKTVITMPIALTSCHDTKNESSTSTSGSTSSTSSSSSGTSGTTGDAGNKGATGTGKTQTSGQKSDKGATGTDKGQVTGQKSDKETPNPVDKQGEDQQPVSQQGHKLTLTEAQKIAYDAVAALLKIWK